jgi:ferredoxin-fold anticodon binding domain-containing protein
MKYQHIENLLIRFRGQAVDIKTISGGVYEGTITDVTNDYVALKVFGADGESDQVIVLLHSIESVLPRSNV